MSNELSTMSQRYMGGGFEEAKKKYIYIYKYFGSETTPMMTIILTWNILICCSDRGGRNPSLTYSVAGIGRSIVRTLKVSCGHLIFIPQILLSYRNINFPSSKPYPFVSPAFLFSSATNS